MKYSSGRRPQKACKKMENCFNFIVKFRPRNIRTKYLNFDTTDGTKWTMAPERQHTNQIGLIMKLIFYKKNYQERCYSLCLEITSAENKTSGMHQLGQKITSAMTEITIDFMELFAKLNYHDPELNNRRDKIFQLASEKLRVKARFRCIEDVAVPPLVRESTSLEDFSNQIYSLFSSAKFYDVIITDNISSMKIHRCMMAARFTNLSKDLKKFRYTGRPIFVEVSPAIMEEYGLLWYYIYSGKVMPMDFFETCYLYQLASVSGLIKLMALCENLLQQNISVKTVCWTLIFTHENSVKDVKLDCKEFINQHLAEVMQYDPGWPEVDSRWAELLEDGPT